LVPFAFVYYPSLLLQGSLGDIFLSIVRTLLATGSILGGTTGYLVTEATVFQRIILIGAGFALMMPAPPVSLAGFIVLVVVVIWQWSSGRREGGFTAS